MKLSSNHKNILTLIGISVASLGSAFAEPSWVSGRPWRAAVFKEFNIKIESQNFSSKQTEQCNQFRNTVNRLLVLPPSYVKAQYLLMREQQAADNAFDSKFSLDFRLSIDSNNLLNSESKAELKKWVDTRSKSENQIPYEFQTSNSIQLDLAATTDINIFNNLQSLSSIGVKLEIQPLSIELIGKNDGIFARVHSMDLACDIIQTPDFSFSLKSNAVAGIEFQEQVLIRNFYGNIAEALAPIINKYNSPTLRAAMSGFRLGKLIEAEFHASTFEQQNQTLEKLISILFEENSFLYSSIWDKEKNTIYPSGQTEKFSVDLNISNNK